MQIEYPPVFATTFNGTATTAQYGLSRKLCTVITIMHPGTVVALGAEEITAVNEELSTKYLVSMRNPHLMNADNKWCTGPL